MKKVFLATAAAAAVAVCAMLARAEMEDALMAGSKTLLQKAIVMRTAMLMREQPPPRVAGANVSEGKAGGVLEVKIETWRGQAGTAAPEKFFARLYWAAGGGAWKSEDFGPGMKTPGTLSAKAPAALGKNTDFSIRAWDEKGRVAVDLACPVKQWPPSDSALNATCLKHAGDGKLEECLAKAVPAGCIFPLGADEAPVDDKPSRAGDDLDLQGVYAAWDSKNIYLIVAVQRQIGAGSMTPASLYQYGFVLMNPMKIAPAGEDLIPHDGVLVRYLPLGETSPGFATPCAAIRNVDGQMTEDTKSVSCETRGGLALISLAREVVGTGTKEFIIIPHTGILSGLKHEDFSFIDMTPPLRIFLGKRNLSVSRN